MYFPVSSRFSDILSDMEAIFTGNRYQIRPVLGGSPRLNVWSKDDGAMLTVEAPELDPSSIGISVDGETLTVSSKSAAQDVAEGANVLRSERSSYEFSRAVTLPFRVDADRAEASYRNGILTVVLPRSEDQKPKKIAVKAA